MCGGCTNGPRGESPALLSHFANEKSVTPTAPWQNEASLYPRLEHLAAALAPSPLRIFRRFIVFFPNLRANPQHSPSLRKW